MTKLPKGSTLLFVSNKKNLSKIFHIKLRHQRLRRTNVEVYLSLYMCLHKCICDTSILLMIGTMRYRKSYHLLPLSLYRSMMITENVTGCVNEST